MLPHAMRLAFLAFGVCLLGCDSTERRASPAPTPAPAPAPPAAATASASASTFAAPSALSALPRAGPPAPAKDAGAGLVVGAERTVERSTLTKVRTIFQGRNVLIGNERNERTVERVLAVKGGAVQKLRVTYQNAVRTRTMDASEQRSPTHLQGKTFVVERRGAEVVVTDEAGQAVAPEEDRDVKDDYRTLGERDPLLGALPSRPLKAGERVAELEAALKRHFESLGDAKNTIIVAGVTATLKGSTKTLHTFAVTIDMQLKGRTQAFSAKLSGDYQARVADGWPTKIAVEGPAAVSLGQGVTPKKGSMRVTRVVSY